MSHINAHTWLFCLLFTNPNLVLFSDFFLAFRYLMHYVFILTFAWTPDMTWATWLLFVERRVILYSTLSPVFALTLSWGPCCSFSYRVLCIFFQFLYILFCFSIFFTWYLSQNVRICIFFRPHLNCPWIYDWTSHRYSLHEKRNTFTGNITKG